jgi:hypothetical protein
VEDVLDRFPAEIKALRDEGLKRKLELECVERIFKTDYPLAQKHNNTQQKLPRNNPTHVTNPVTKNGKKPLATPAK